MTGRPARGIVNRVMREIGPINPIAPEFPLAAGALAPLRAKAEAQGSGDFSPMWSGQAAALGRAMPARELTHAGRRGAGAVARHVETGVEPPAFGSCRGFHASAIRRMIGPAFGRF